MGLIKRLRRITRARIETFLSAVEDPEKIFPQLVKEMEGNVAESCRAEAKALSAVQAAQRKLDEAGAQVGRFGRGAELALAKGDEATAREALAAQVRIEKSLDVQRDVLSHTESAFAEASALREQIEAELSDLKLRKQEILSRAHVARTRKKAQKTVSHQGKAGDSILDEVSRIEEKLAEDEAGLDIEREMVSTGPAVSLDERLLALRNEVEVGNRLAALRGKKKN